MLPPRVKVDWRVKDGKKPEGVILCGRPGAWANPFKVGVPFTPWEGAKPIEVPDAATACKFFRTYAKVKLSTDPTWLDPLYLATGLACPGCDPEDEHCHVQILLSLMAERLG